MFKNKGNLPKMLCTGIGFVLMVCAVMTLMTWQGDYEERLNEIQIGTSSGIPVYQNPGSDMQSQTDVQAPSVEVLSQEDASEAVAAAQRAVDDVTSGQMERLEIVKLYDIPLKNGDEHDEARQRSQDLYARMSKYFDEKKYADSWYNWNTSKYDDISWTGTVCLNYSGDLVPVVFRCMDGEGNVLAYMTADYDPEVDQFINSFVGITTAGRYKSDTTADVDVVPEEPTENLTLDSLKDLMEAWDEYKAAHGIGDEVYTSTGNQIVGEGDDGR